MALSLLALTAGAQPRYDYSKLNTEKLDRGVVAIPQADGTVAVTWRTLRSDRKAEPFDVFRNGVKMNSEPLTSGGNFIVDKQAVQGDVTYKVVGGNCDGEFTLTGILLDNAIRYSDENGIIRLKLFMKGSRIILTVFNTVTHISRSELPKLTERFYRSDTSRSAESNSHGIGLPSVEEIVRAHHGEMILSTEDEQSFLVTIKL